MHYLKKTTFFFLFFGVSLVFSCQKESDKQVDLALEALPTNATIVTAFDLPTLMEKANFEEVKKMDFYQFFMEKAQEESDMLAAVFANPENAGIDLTKNAYVSIELNPDNPEEIYTGIIFNLASSEDFNGFANSFRNAAMGNRQGYKIADLNESTQLAWNDKVGVIALGEGVIETEEVVNSFFAPSNEQSLSNNENLNQLLSERHDVTTWLTTNALAKNPSAKLVLSLAQIKPEAIDDNFIHGHLDFEKGQVNSKLNYFFQEELIQDVNLLFKEAVKTDFSKHISNKNLNVYLSAALDFNGLNMALQKRPQVKMFVDFALKSYGLSVQKLRNSLDGDLVFATYTGNINNRLEGLLAIKLRDTDQFEALMRVAEEKDLVTQTAKGRYLVAPSLSKMISGIVPFEIGSNFDNQIIIKDGIAFLSDNIDRLDAIDNGTLSPTEKTPQNIQNLVNQNPIALFIDFNSLKRVGLPGAQALEQLNFSSDKEGAQLNLSLKNGEVNSLQAILEVVNEEFLKNREQKQPVSQEKS